MKRALAALVALAALAACACDSSPRSEAELKAEFERFVADKRACAVTDDCALASTSCPLGCGAAVAKPNVPAVEAKARELVSEYESDGKRCDYGCPFVEVRCQQSLCTVVSGD